MGRVISMSEWKSRHGIKDKEVIEPVGIIPGGTKISETVVYVTSMRNPKSFHYYRDCSHLESAVTIVETTRGYVDEHLPSAKACRFCLDRWYE